MPGRLPRPLRTLVRSLSAASSSSSSSPCLAWRPTGKPQKTLASEASLSGTALHSGERTTVKLLPAMAGEGRYFVRQGVRIPANIDYAVDVPLSTALCKGGVRVRTVEHLLSAMEASGVDNARIEIHGGDEVPILDGSSMLWMEMIKQAGLSTAKDQNGNSVVKMEAFLSKPVYLQKNDSFLAAFPSPDIQVTYGINFPQISAVQCQWFTCFPMNTSVYVKEIAPSRTFCVYEEIENMRDAGFIKGGSSDNAIVCSVHKGWLNPPLRFDDEPCRHKVLDLVGDISLLARDGSQGFPVAHVIAYKAGHSLHTELVHYLLYNGSKPDNKLLT